MFGIMIDLSYPMSTIITIKTLERSVTGSHRVLWRNIVPRRVSERPELPI